ncbi:MAG TPA: HAMP domain-containing sensor histidine kinase [Xanthomonadaceae bacterium]|jgi:two-component system sensor histidine kinase PilS (NtrC family)
MIFELRASAPGEAGLRRELYFLSLFRVLEGGLLAFVTFSPLAAGVVTVRNLSWAGTATVAHMLAGIVLFVLARNPRWRPRNLVAAGIALDLSVFAVLLHNLVGFSNGISLLLLFNVGAYALLLRLGWGLTLASLAALVQIGDYVFSRLVFQEPQPVPEMVMFGVSYLATAMLTNLLGRQLRESEVLAEQRGAEVDNLARVNEMIIRRMRTGLIAVDSDNIIRLFNESAWYLLGNPSPERRTLGDVAPELSRRLWHWRQQQKVDTTPLSLAPDTPAVIPRFTALGGAQDLTLIFLDDTSLLSRRAEELTLTTLGRLAASVAHEIRNPLAAISHAGQLLRESTIEPETDHRLVEIINSQCQRMDGIVQNVLGLARRERSRPESLELVAWAERFIADFHRTQPDERDELRISAPQGPLRAMMDPQHLQQVVTVLVQNALTYGRMPGEAARVTLVVHREGNEGEPLLDVVDRGPGIPAAVVEHLFEPFYTTSEHGTGLGLYIARQLCEANQASLNFVSLPAGGSCFRIALARTEPVSQRISMDALAAVGKAV